jgi:hypothetical protein
MLNRQIEEPRIIKGKSDLDFSKFLRQYEGSVENLEVLTTNESLKSEKWNQSLPVPLGGLEQVYIHPDQEGVQESYVRIIFGEKNYISVFNRSHLKGQKISAQKSWTEMMNTSVPEVVVDTDKTEEN